MIAHSSSITTMPNAKPAAGEVTIARTTFHSRPPFSFQLPPGSDQIGAAPSLSATETAAPHGPPHSPSEDDAGSPYHPVTRISRWPPPPPNSNTSETRRKTVTG